MGTYLIFLNLSQAFISVGWEVRRCSAHAEDKSSVSNVKGECDFGSTVILHFIAICGCKRYAKTLLEQLKKKDTLSTQMFEVKYVNDIHFKIETLVNLSHLLYRI